MDGAFAATYYKLRGRQSEQTELERIRRDQEEVEDRVEMPERLHQRTLRGRQSEQTGLGEDGEMRCLRVFVIRQNREEQDEI